MQGFEEELFTLMSKQEDALITQEDALLFYNDYEAQRAKHLVERKEQQIYLKDELKKLTMSSFADTTPMQLARLYKLLEIAHVDFSNRKYSKYTALLKRLRVSLAKKDLKEAKQTCKEIAILKSMKTDLRMQTLYGQIAEINELLPYNRLKIKQLNVYQELLSVTMEVRMLEKN